MAVGDIVHGVSADNVVLVFRPAAGVDICITAFNAHNIYTRLTDGTDYPMFSANIGTNAYQSSQFNSKIMINNDIWIDMLGSATGDSYTGIQIK